MPEASLYRRHRPQSFDEVVGQEHVVRTLRNAVERDRVHHAYLFVGSRGTGKTSAAKILARSLNCEQGPTVKPCGKCESCRTIAGGTSLDVIEMDAASNRSVDDIRDLRERVGYVPAAGRWKVYIIDEAHMLTREAWNAFLKTLEEPPPNTVFVLATTEPHKVMPTIVDRCQRFDFQRPTLEQIAEVLNRVATAEKIEIEDGAVEAIARAANGSFRDALATLDQLLAYGGSPVATDDVLAVLGVADAELIFSAAEAIAGGDGKGALEAAEELARSGRDVAQFIRDLVAHLRQLLVIRTAGTVPDSFSVTAAHGDRLGVQAGRFSDASLIRAVDELSAALSAIREGDDARTSLEVALLKSARPDTDASREALAERLERLERLERAVAGQDQGGDGPVGLEPEAAEVKGPEPAAEPAERGNPGSDEDESGENREVRASVEVDLERIVGLWPAVVDQVRHSGSELLSTVFRAARPVAVDAESAIIKIGFPRSAAFNKRKAEAASNRDRFAEAVRVIVGQSLRPVYVLLDGEEERGSNGEESELTDDELIERIKSEFDAEEFDAEESDPADAEGGTGR